MQLAALLLEKKTEELSEGEAENLVPAKQRAERLWQRNKSSERRRAD
jgi:hypothetical protein